MKTTWLAMGVAALCAAGACGPAGKAPLPEDFADLAGLDGKSDKFSSRLRLLGSLPHGRERRHRYSGSPRYRGYQIKSGGGELVEVWVRSSDGDPVAWLTDESFGAISESRHNRRR